MQSVIAAQLYTVREHVRTPADLAASLKRLREAGFEAVETAGLGKTPLAEWRRIVSDAGIRVCAMHHAYEQYLERPDSVIEEHRALGCNHAVIPLLADKYRADIDTLRRTTQEIDGIGRRLADAGITLSYHNHSFEFARFGEGIGMDILFGETAPRRLKAEIDTYWIQHGGGDPVAWIQRLGDRIDLLHVKDMTIIDNEPAFAEVGEGNLNWPRILDAAAAAGVKWYIIEQDCCRRDPFDSLRISLENLRAMGLE